MKFILTAGGTGGHIYPALSVLEEIKKVVQEIVENYNKKVEDFLKFKNSIDASN